MSVLENSMTLAIFLLLASNCGAVQSGRDGQAERPGPIEIPGPDLGPEDEIDAVDLVVDPRGVLHVAWREVDRRTDRSGVPEYRTFYSSGLPGGETWSEPEALPFRARPRLALVAGRIYILAGPELEVIHWESSGSLRSFGSRLPESLSALLDFDVAASGGDPVVAGLARGRAGALTLCVFGILENSGLQWLADLKPSAFDQPAPRLVADGGRLHLLWAVNEEKKRLVERHDTKSEEISSRGRVFYARSEDRGATWSKPVELTADAPEPPEIIDSVELILDGDDVIAFYASFGLFSSRSRDGFVWSRPVRVSGTSGSSLEGGTGVRSLAAAGGVIVWVDERYQNRDRRWWNPLGGWPWSDSPDWANNDLLLISLAQLRSASGYSRVEPRRLTRELTYVEKVRAGASRENIYLLWAGRYPVGKARDSRGAKPTLYLERRVPRP